MQADRQESLQNEINYGGDMGSLARDLTWQELPTVGWFECPGCHELHASASGYANKEGQPYIWYRSYANKPAYEIHIVVAFVDDDTDKFPAFGARFGLISDQEGWGFSHILPNTIGLPFSCRELVREAALTHPRVAEFWEVIDWLHFTDPVMHQVVQHGVLPDTLDQMMPWHDVPLWRRWLVRRRLRRGEA